MNASEPGRDWAAARELQTALAAMIGTGLGSAVCLINGEEGLLGEEHALMTNAVASRRREFAAGRRCARAALAAIGCSPRPIGRGALMEPLFPPGFAGSITHDGRFAAAIAYPVDGRQVAASIDLLDRPDRALFGRLSASILSPDDFFEDDEWRDDPVAVSRVFSAKEAAIKIFSERYGSLIDFRELRAARRWSSLIVTMPETGLAADIRYRDHNGILLTVARELERLEG